MSNGPLQVYYPYPQTYYSPQWVQYITPILVGVMMLVVIAGMVRDLFKGRKVELPEL